MSVRGIGPAAAKALTDLGISTAEDLAAASPDTVAKVRGISPTAATVVIGIAGEVTGIGGTAAKTGKATDKKAAKAGKKANKKSKAAKKKAAKAKKKAAKAEKKAAEAARIAAEADMSIALNRAIEVLGDRKWAIEWLEKMSGTFGKSPKQALSDEGGLARVLSHLRGVDLALNRY